MGDGYIVGSSEAPVVQTTTTEGYTKFSIYTDDGRFGIIDMDGDGKLSKGDIYLNPAGGKTTLVDNSQFVLGGRIEDFLQTFS